ncbi:MAG: hypothetical protein ACYDDF_04470 [Thermoplasmatota archaeon]
MVVSKLGPVPLAACTFAICVAGCVGSGTPTSHGTGPGNASTTTGTSAITPTIYYESNHGNVTMALGSNLTLVLNSTYWGNAQSTNPAVLRLTDGPHTTPCSNPPFPGTGCGNMTATFSAIAIGSAHIQASRASCGEALACQPNETTFDAAVTVH